MKLKVKIAAFAVMGIALGVNAQEKITTENGAKSDFIYKGGNVGIGTISPVEKLDLRGDLHINSGINDNHIFWSGHNMTMGTRPGNYAHNVFNLKPGGADQGFLFSVFKMHVARSKTNHEVKVQFHSNSSSFINGGRLGIGTAKPDKLLTLKSNSYLGWEYTDEGSGSHHTITGGGTNPMSFTVKPFSANNPIFNFNGHNGTKVTILNGGNVGIGITTPSNPLHIVSSSNHHQLKLQGANGKHSWIQFYPNGTNLLNWQVGANTNGFSIYDITNSKYNFTVSNSGNVGIGTIKPTAKLAVNGKIHTKEIRVDLNLTDWADFVFYDDYKLPTLTEVENHIIEKGHLKDIPSAKEVAQNGIFLGQMDAKLLQKIEELTLYTIQQEKKIKTLEAEKTKTEKLEKEVETLKKLVSQLLKDKE